MVPQSKESILQISRAYLSLFDFSQIPFPFNMEVFQIQKSVERLPEKKIERDFFIFFHSFSNLFFFWRASAVITQATTTLRRKRPEKDQKEIYQAKISKGDFSEECWPLTNLSSTTCTRSKILKVMEITRNYCISDLNNSQFLVRNARNSQFLICSILDQHFLSETPCRLQYDQSLKATLFALNDSFKSRSTYSTPTFYQLQRRLLMQFSSNQVFCFFFQIYLESNFNWDRHWTLITSKKEMMSTLNAALMPSQESTRLSGSLT